MVDAEPAAKTPLSAVADAFEGLVLVLESDSPGDGCGGGGGDDLSLTQFTDACSLVSVLFGCLGLAFKFAEFEYVNKVNDLIEASKAYDTLDCILDHDVQHDTVKKQGSHSRNLRRVRLGLALIRVLFENFLLSSDYSLQEAASNAYEQVCAPFHTWAIRKAVGVGMYALPSREELIYRLKENDISVRKEMLRYINSSLPIIQYIDNLFLSRDIILDW